VKSEDEREERAQGEEEFYNTEGGSAPRPRDIAKVYKKENKRLHRVQQFGKGKKEQLIGTAKKMRR
jgi:hypothetical protein